MAAKDAFSLAFKGKSAHVAVSALGRDAILAACSTVVALYSTLNRERNPSELVAVNIGTIAGGRSQSAIADSVELTGTIRNRDPEVRARLKKSIERVSRRIAITFDVSCTITCAMITSAKGGGARVRV